MYHQRCFTGDADPRTQVGSTFTQRQDYHNITAPKLSCLEGPSAVHDRDGRTLGRTIFKPAAPRTVGQGKWSVQERGYRPKT